jgi:hypothetical protein
METNGKPGGSGTVSPREAQRGGQGGVDPLLPGLQIDHAEGAPEKPQGVPGTDEDLSNNEISLLCDIGEFKSVREDVQSGAIARLQSRGYIEPASSPAPGARFKLTAKAQQFLLERGAGLNEA